MRAVGSAGEVRWVIESRSRRRMPGRAACAETAASDAFQQPIAYADVRGADDLRGIDGLGESRWLRDGDAIAAIITTP